MSDTPRTDEAEEYNLTGDFDYVNPDFARRLERELNEATRKLQPPAQLKDHEEIAAKCADKCLKANVRWRDLGGVMKGIIYETIQTACASGQEERAILGQQLEDALGEIRRLTTPAAPPKDVEERINELAMDWYDKVPYFTLANLRAMLTELATELTKGREAKLAALSRIVHDEMHECGCTGGSFIYGCRHSVRRLRQLLADLGQSKP